MTSRPRFWILVAVVCAVTAAAVFFNVYHGLYHESAARLKAADIGSFASTLAWVKSAGFFFVFLAMVIEGPIVTAAAAFAAAVGYFNIFTVFALAVLADLVGNVVYYYIGYFGRVKIVLKYGHHVGLTEGRLKRMERLIKKHPKKTVTAIKLTPLLATPGLMMIGATRMPVVRYSTLAFFVALPKVILFIFLGYYFGHAYDRFSQIFENSEYVILFAVAFTVIAFYAYKKIAAAIANRLEAI